MKERSKLPLAPTFVVVGAAAVAAIVMAQTERKPHQIATVQANADRGSKDSLLTKVASVDRKPLSFYTGGVRTDLFNTPVVAPPKKAETKKPLPAPVVTPEPVPDPFADYGYTGTVNMGGTMVALIENIKTKDGNYYRQGDPFPAGGTVSEISDRSVTVMLAPGKPHAIAKNDDFKLTPLDKSAAYLTEQPPQAAGAPGQPGAPNGAPPNPADMAARLKARFPNMTDDQIKQMQDRWTNRRFNGGGRGGGGFGGGGFGGGRRGGGGGFGGGGGYGGGDGMGFGFGG